MIVEIKKNTFHLHVTIHLHFTYMLQFTYISLTCYMIPPLIRS